MSENEIRKGESYHGRTKNKGGGENQSSPDCPNGNNIIECKAPTAGEIKNLNNLQGIGDVSTKVIPGKASEVGPTPTKDLPTGKETQISRPRGRDRGNGRRKNVTADGETGTRKSGRYRDHVISE